MATIIILLISINLVVAIENNKRQESFLISTSLPINEEIDFSAEREQLWNLKYASELLKGSPSLISFTEMATEAIFNSERVFELEIIKTAERVEIMEIEELEQFFLEDEDDQGDQDSEMTALYNVYKNGFLVEVSPEVQNLIRDLAEQYNFDEKIIFGTCLTESTFNASAGTVYKGLTQIGNFWITLANIPRFTDDWKSRNLYDPYDNLITCMEMWCYARDTYNIDTSTEQGMKDLLYWHNTGKYVKNVSWNYSNLCFKYANELVAIDQ